MPHTLKRGPNLLVIRSPTMAGQRVGLSIVHNKLMQASRSHDCAQTALSGNSEYFR